MGRFPRVMPANAGIQDTTTLTEFRLCILPPGASLAPPRRVPLDTRFRGYDKPGFPERCAWASTNRRRALNAQAEIDHATPAEEISLDEINISNPINQGVSPQFYR